MSGYSNSYGNNDFVLLTLSRDFESCGNLIANDIALPSLDVTSHADLIFQDIALTQDFSSQPPFPTALSLPQSLTSCLSSALQMERIFACLQGKALLLVPLCLPQVSAAALPLDV